jgi:hypothetical protein
MLRWCLNWVPYADEQKKIAAAAKATRKTISDRVRGILIAALEA